MNKDLTYIISVMNEDNNAVFYDEQINEGILRTIFKFYKTSVNIISYPAMVASGILTIANPVLGVLLMTGIFVTNKYLAFIDKKLFEKVKKDEDYKKLNEKIEKLIKKMNAISNDIKSDFLKVGKQRRLFHLTFDKYFIYMFDKKNPEKDVTLNQKEAEELEIYNAEIKKLPEYSQKLGEMQHQINSYYKELEPIVKRYEEKK